MFLFALMIAVVAYLIGSVSSAILVSKKMDLPDPKTYGSGNPGATNVLRSGNKKAAAYTLLGDAVKGLLAVGLARCLTAWLGLPDYTVGLAAIAVVLGHMYPIFFSFKGGKGVATGVGVILAMSFWTAFWVALIWATIAFKFKKSSLAALVAAAVAPFVAFIVIQHPYHPSWGWSLVVVSALVIMRHRDNIKRMQAGNEPDVGNTAAPAEPANPVAPIAASAPQAEQTQKVEQVLVLQKNARRS